MPLKAIKARKSTSYIVLLDKEIVGFAQIIQQDAKTIIFPELGRMSERP
ncbi:MAG: hypothetical protein H5T50_04620 [Nitrososphaeria archaeon]|nr:hypothetical protein [Nitrososphaeria archaeon]